MPKVKKDYKKKYGADLGVDLEQRSSHTTVSVLKAIINKTPQKQKVETILTFFLHKLPIIYCVLNAQT